MARWPSIRRLLVRATTIDFMIDTRQLRGHSYRPIDSQRTRGPRPRLHDEAASTPFIAVGLRALNHD